MKMEVTETGLTKIMLLIPNTREEANSLADFSHPDTPLKATITLRPAYGYPYIEIRKED